MLLFLEDVVPLEFPDFALNKTDVCVKISLAFVGLTLWDSFSTQRRTNFAKISIGNVISNNFTYFCLMSR